MTSTISFHSVSAAFVKDLRRLFSCRRCVSSNTEALCFSSQAQQSHRCLGWGNCIPGSEVTPNAIKGNEYARKKKSERKKLCLLALTPHLSPAIATHHPLLAQDFVSSSGISPPPSSNRPTTERWFQEFMDNNQAVITCLCKVTLSHLGDHLRTRLIPGIPCPYFSNPAWEKQLLVLFSY